MLDLKKIVGFKNNKPGFNHWWAQRLSAVILAITGILFLTLLLKDQPFSYNAARAWFQNPWHYFLSLLLSLSLLMHFYLGLEKIVNDYIHEDADHKLIMAVLKWSVVCIAIGYLLTLTILQALHV